jgi:hypothetical protein
MMIGVEALSSLLADCPQDAVIKAITSIVIRDNVNNLSIEEYILPLFYTQCYVCLQRTVVTRI